MPSATPTTIKPTSQPSAMPSSCRLLPNPIDICLLIDGSESIDDPQFALSLEFTRDIVNKVSTMSSDSSYSVVVFSSDAQLVGARNENAAATIVKLTNTHHPKQGTQTVEGFNACQATFENVDRPHIILLLTDGDPNGAGSNAEALAEATAAATAAKNAGTIIVSIGVGTLISTTNLMTWATNPGFVFTATDFTGLASITDNIINQLKCGP